MFKGVFSADSPPFDGNTDRTNYQDPYIFHPPYQQVHPVQLQFYLRAPFRAYTERDDYLYRTYCLTHWSYRPGLLPSVNLKRITFEGNIHWAGTEQLEQITLYSELKQLLSPSVFVALVFDHGDADYFTPPSVGLPDVPILRLSRAFDMHMSQFDELPYLPGNRPNPYPGPSVWPTEDMRYEVLWHKTFIPSLEPAKTFELISDLPSGEPPVGTLRTYRYLDRMAYFRGSVDCDLTVRLGQPFLNELGQSTIDGATGNLYMVAWQTGGIATNSEPQQVYCNWWSHVHHDLNPS